MNNLEFMHRYNLEKLNIAELSEEQLLEFIESKTKDIELERIRIQAAEHLLREKGVEVKRRESESALSYVPVPEEQLRKLEKKLSKDGKSAAEIKEISQAIQDLDFSDI